jgi:two-component system, sensor histidine kinase
MDTLQAPARPLTVLIVEDHADSARTLARAVGLLGHTALVARDGFGGLDAALESAPDVALVDIGLPGLDGWSLAERLLRCLPYRPLLVAVTGYGAPRDRDRSWAAGFDYHLVKPIDLDDLGELLRRRAGRLPRG